MRIVFSLLLFLLAGCLPPSPGPQPDPDPPRPDPEPAPVVDACWLITVSETGERTPGQAEILNDLEFWTGLESIGCRFRHYDDDQPAARSYVTAAAKARERLPVLVVLAPDGVLLDLLPLPRDTSTIREIVRKVTGK